MNLTLKPKKLLGKKFKRVLVIPDMHMPYHHPDTISFLKALKAEVKPDLVVNLGDEVDGHAMSYHEADPDLFSAGHELDRAIRGLQPLYKLFPNMLLLDSNHGSLAHRKGRSAGLPDRMIRSAKEVLEAPKGWEWCSELTFKTELGLVNAVHGKSAASGRRSKDMAMCTMQGHYHNKFQIEYWGSPMGLYWDAHFGCLVDDNSRAMAYNKLTTHRPIIGAGKITDGRVHLVPMHLNKHHRWTGRL